MATVYDIIKGISQAAANAYDGSQYEKYAADGEARTIGLRREQGDAVLDSRVMDGFKVRISGNKLIVNYQSEMALKEIHNSKLDEEMEQNMSRLRTWAQATKVYTIGGMDEVKALNDGNTPEERFKEFLSLSSDKKPTNVK
jgi:hypothetical protein